MPSPEDRQSSKWDFPAWLCFSRLELRLRLRLRFNRRVSPNDKTTLSLCGNVTQPILKRPGDKAGKICLLKVLDLGWKRPEGLSGIAG